MTKEQDQKPAGIDEIGRICPYARQQCLLEHGCVTVDSDIFGANVLEIESAALQCEQRGSMLYADEITRGKLHRADNIVERRTFARQTRITTLERQLADRRRRARSETVVKEAIAVAESQGRAEGGDAMT